MDMDNHDSYKLHVMLYKFINQPTTAQFVCNLRHVSVATIRPSSGRMLFLDNEQRIVVGWLTL
jgi:hypothetical protein